MIPCRQCSAAATTPHGLCAQCDTGDTRMHYFRLALLNASQDLGDAWRGTWRAPLDMDKIAALVASAKATVAEAERWMALTDGAERKEP